VGDRASLITQEYFTKHTNIYKYLQGILEQRAFSKVIKKSKLEGLGEET
jgi:hypothetical protein